MKHLSKYIEDLQANGKRAFTFEEAKNALNGSNASIKSSLYRIKQKGEIVDLLKGYYLIIPPEYRILGCLPPDQVVPLIMGHLKLEYYVGLLSAAMYYGASHQKPQVFQVITKKQFRPLQCGQTKIQFIVKKDLEKIPVQTKTVPTGYLIISSPEATAMDLFLYPKSSGGLNHIATILSELVEELNADKLIKLSKKINEISWIQRLGYLLETIEPFDKEKTDSIIIQLKKYINSLNPKIIPLHWNFPKKWKEKNEVWRIIVNTTVESDL